MQIIKDNPWKSILGGIGTLVPVITGLFALDARYAHADEVEKNKTETKQLIISTTQDLRRQMLEDKLFELDLKKAQNKNGQLSATDAALRDRYQRQLDELTRRKQN